MGPHTRHCLYTDRLHRLYTDWGYRQACRHCSLYTASVQSTLSCRPVVSLPQSSPEGHLSPCRAQRNPVCRRHQPSPRQSVSWRPHPTSTPVPFQCWSSPRPSSLQTPSNLPQSHCKLASCLLYVPTVSPVPVSPVTRHPPVRPFLVFTVEVSAFPSSSGPGILSGQSQSLRAWPWQTRHTSPSIRGSQPGGDGTGTH